MIITNVGLQPKHYEVDFRYYVGDDFNGFLKLFDKDTTNPLSSIDSQIDGFQGSIVPPILTSPSPTPTQHAGYVESYLFLYLNNIFRNTLKLDFKFSIQNVLLFNTAGNPEPSGKISMYRTIPGAAAQADLSSSDIRITASGVSPNVMGQELLHNMGVVHQENFASIHFGGRDTLALNTVNRMGLDRVNSLYDTLNALIGLYSPPAGLSLTISGVPANLKGRSGNDMRDFLVFLSHKNLNKIFFQGTFDESSGVFKIFIPELFMQKFGEIFDSMTPELKTVDMKMILIDINTGSNSYKYKIIPSIQLFSNTDIDIRTSLWNGDFPNDGTVITDKVIPEDTSFSMA